MTNVDTNPESTHLTLTAQRGASHALAFARKGGAGLSALLNGIAHAKQTERMGPLWGFVFITDTYSEDEQAMIPIIGSRQVEGSNQPFDRYSQKVTVDGQEKTIQGSWLTDATRATVDWQALQHRRECCEDVTVADCPVDIRQMGSVSRNQEKLRIISWQKDMRTGLSNSVMLFHQFMRINKLNPATIKVRLPLREENKLDVNGNATGETHTVVYSNIIRLEDPSKEHEDILMNVNQFNSLKPDKIPAGEAVTIKSLELTAARAPKGKKDKSKGKADIAVPNTVELLLNIFNVAGTAIDTETPEGNRLNAAVLQACTPNKDGTYSDKAKDVIETIGTFCIRADSIWTVISGPFQQIQNDKLNAANAAAAAAALAKRQAKAS